ncbi:hypothetical protein PALB_34810 [Pseudoalteromonas luteoviolacea B = ATCC 29581]|nr:hypothetical protein PALB_34810 [Pseudoalteromonas luteoviolacea B = ATCC 29581]
MGVLSCHSKMLIAMFCLCCLNQHANATKYLDVIAVEYPPFTSQSLNADGILFEMLQEQYSLPIGWSYRSYFLPPARAQQLVESNDWCLSFYPPQGINELIDFLPLGREFVTLGFIVLKGSELDTWQMLPSLAGRSVTLLRNSIETPTYHQLVEANATVVFVEKTEQGIELLAKGRVDMAFSDDYSFHALQKTNADWANLTFASSILRRASVGVYINRACESIDAFIQLWQKKGA